MRFWFQEWSHHFLSSLAVWGSGPKTQPAHIQGHSATWTLKGHLQKSFFFFFFCIPQTKLSASTSLVATWKVEYIHLVKYFQTHTSMSLALSQLQRTPRCVYACVAYVFRNTIGFGESNQNTFCLLGNECHRTSLWGHCVSPQTVPHTQPFNSSKIKPCTYWSVSVRAGQPSLKSA